MQRFHPTTTPLRGAGVVVAALLGGALSLGAQQGTETPLPAGQLPSDVEVVLDRDAALRLNLAVPRSRRPPGARPEFLDAMSEVEQTLREDLALFSTLRRPGPGGPFGGSSHRRPSQGSRAVPRLRQRSRVAQRVQARRRGADPRGTGLRPGERAVHSGEAFQRGNRPRAPLPPMRCPTRSSSTSLAAGASQ